MLRVITKQCIYAYFDSKCKILFVFFTKKEEILSYSTVAFVQCNAVSSSADLTYNFTITYRRPPFNVPLYSQYQFFLYETITEQRGKGKTFDQIAEWLNKKGYLSVRGKKFKGNHVHSIVKKKRLKDE